MEWWCPSSCRVLAAVVQHEDSPTAQRHLHSCLPVESAIHGVYQIVVNAITLFRLLSKGLQPRLQLQPQAQRANPLVARLGNATSREAATCVPYPARDLRTGCNHPYSGAASTLLMTCIGLSAAACLWDCIHDCVASISAESLLRII